MMVMRKWNVKLNNFFSQRTSRSSTISLIAITLMSEKLLFSRQINNNDGKDYVDNLINMDPSV